LDIVHFPQLRPFGNAFTTAERIMTQTSPSLELPYVQGSQAQKHVTVNEALQRLDALAQLTLEDTGVNTPPPSPLTGQVYGTGAAATSDWQGQPGQLAVRTATGWLFVTPRIGWRAWRRADDVALVWDGADWVAELGSLDNLDQVGIGTTADATNRLALSSPASLFSHAGSGHQIKVNKAGLSDTGSLLFQTNWVGHAEMGLAGDNSYSIKISPDGSAWITAMRLDPAAQDITLAPAGTDRIVIGDTAAQFDLPITGDAVQQSADDTTPGRVMRADYGYGPGNLLGAVSETGGAPTGAVLERGTNANGCYTRFADGTQICTHRVTLNYLGGFGCGATWTFPAAYEASKSDEIGVSFSVEVPASSYTPANEGLSLSDIGTPAGGQILLQQRRLNGLTNFQPGDFVVVRAIAIGPWF
jgi:hypothetical protein